MNLVSSHCLRWLACNTALADSNSKKLCLKHDPPCGEAHHLQNSEAQSCWWYFRIAKVRIRVGLKMGYTGNKKRIWLFGWWFGACFIFPYIGNVIIPTDFNSIIFQRGGEKPPTRYINHISTIYHINHRLTIISTIYLPFTSTTNQLCSSVKLWLID